MANVAPPDDQAVPGSIRQVQQERWSTSPMMLAGRRLGFTHWPAAVSVLRTDVGRSRFLAQVAGGVDQRNMREGLREVADEPFGVWVVLFG